MSPHLTSRWERTLGAALRIASSAQVDYHWVRPLTVVPSKPITSLEGGTERVWYEVSPQPGVSQKRKEIESSLFH